MVKKDTFWHPLGKVLKYLFKTLRFVLTIPFYIIKWMYERNKSAEKELEEMKIEIKREAIKPVYEDFLIVQKESGNYEKWKKTVVRSDSKIGIIIGSRGSGKTAFGVKFLENAYAQTKKKCYAIGFNKKDFPAWIQVIESIDQIENDSFVLIDEGGVLFSSRRAMSNANKLLSDLLMIARHKNLNILFISQNSSNLEVNILRQADYLVLKPSSLLQQEFERKIVQKLYEKTKKQFENYKDRIGITYIYANEFQGFVTNSLPSFWKTAISKSFKEKKSN